MVLYTVRDIAAPCGTVKIKELLIKINMKTLNVDHKAVVTLR